MTTTKTSERTMMTNAWDGDENFETVTIASVSLRPDGWWELVTSNGVVCGFDPARHDEFTPRIGDTARLYSAGANGRPRGLMIRDRMIHWAPTEDGK